MTRDSLGQVLTTLLAKGGLTLNALSQKSGVPLTSLHRLFHDQVVKPNPVQLAEIARALDVPPRVLLFAAHYPVPGGADGVDAALRAAYPVPDEAIAQMRAAVEAIAARYTNTTGTGEAQ
jgi:transcriptional regulator with XRE-family HTH domain